MGIRPRDARPLWAPLAGAVAVAWALATSHQIAAAVAAAIPLAIVALGAALKQSRCVPARVKTVALVLALLVVSTFVWRVRTTQALDSNPLDAAASVRVAMVAAAGLIAMLALLVAGTAPPRLPRSLLFLFAYVVAAALAAANSPAPLQALYRVFELGAGLLLPLLALALLGPRSGAWLVRLAIGCVGGIVVLVWAEALLLPQRAWEPLSSMLPYQLVGVLPDFAANTVGTLGGVLALWGLARAEKGRLGARLADAALVLGSATLLAAQYRTGIVAVLLAGTVVAWHRRRRVFVLIAAVSALCVLYVGFDAVRSETQTAFARGRPELVSTLNGRTDYWHASVPLIRDRPVFGWGLNVESRRVLVSLGDDTTSTIHGTWIEALLGTGVVGTALLAAAFLSALRDAWCARRTALGIACLGLIAFLLVRSSTGSTVELFGLGFVLFTSVALAAAQLRAAGRLR